MQRTKELAFRRLQFNLAQNIDPEQTKKLAKLMGMRGAALYDTKDLYGLWKWMQCHKDDRDNDWWLTPTQVDKLDEYLSIIGANNPTIRRLIDGYKTEMGLAPAPGTTITVPPGTQASIELGPMRTEPASSPTIIYQMAPPQPMKICSSAFESILDEIEAEERETRQMWIREDATLMKRRAAEDRRRKEEDAAIAASRASKEKEFRKRRKRFRKMEAKRKRKAAKKKRSKEASPRAQQPPATGCDACTKGGEDYIVVPCGHKICETCSPATEKKCPVKTCRHPEFQTIAKIPK